MTAKSVHEIEMENTSEWGKCFNRCSELFNLFRDESLPIEEQRKYYDEYVSERWLLEQGYLDK